MKEKAFGKSLEGCARGQCADPRRTIPAGTGPATVRGSSPRGLARTLGARLPLTRVAKLCQDAFTGTPVLCRNDALVVSASFSRMVARTKNSSDFGFQRGQNFLLS